MINRVNFSMPQYQQKQAFTGREEIELIKAAREGLEKMDGNNITTLSSRLNVIKSRIPKELIKDFPKDLKTAADEAKTWHSRFFNMYADALKSLK